MNGLILEEDLKYGQKIIAVNITVSTSGETKLQQKITTVGSKRIIVFPEPINASEIAIVVLESKGLPIFKTIRAF
jgi:hypothetical protein